MLQIAWIALAWAAGIAAILGSLMTLGSLLFWLVPASQPRSRNPDSQLDSGQIWRDRMKLLLVSLAIALAGLSVLAAVPTPFSH